MEKLRTNMEQSRGETVVLSTGLKDKGNCAKAMMDEDEDDYERFSEDEDAIDEDEEVGRFSF